MKSGPCIDVKNEDLIDFNTFVKSCEDANVFMGSGILKVRLDAIKVTSNKDLLSKLMQHCNLSKPEDQQFYAPSQDSNVFGWFAREVTKERLKDFRILLSNDKNFSVDNETCCTKVLTENDDSLELMSHYYTALHQIAMHVKQTSPSYHIDQLDEMKRAGAALKDQFENKTKLSDPLTLRKRASKQKVSKSTHPWTPVRKCPRRSVCNPKHDGNIIYGSGLQLPENEKILITKDFTLSKLNTLLDLHPDNYPGLHQPFFYVGTCHSTFALHIEDAALWSINYLHCGAPKVWLTVYPEYVDKLKLGLYGSRLQLEHTACHNVLGHKHAIVDPAFLNSLGIPFTVTVQHPGEFVILQPNAAHQGFNMGNNVAEAVNFATESWILDGLNSPICACFESKQVHLDMTPFLSMYYPELLEPYITGKRYLTPASEPQVEVLMDSKKLQAVSSGCSQLSREAGSAEEEANEGHLMTSDGRILLQCTECPKMFKGGRGKMKRLLQHCKREHSSLKTIKADILKRYAPRKHKLEKKLSCPECGLKIAGCPSNLKLHISRKHS